MFFVDEGYTAVVISSVATSVAMYFVDKGTSVVVAWVLKSFSFVDSHGVNSLILVVAVNASDVVLTLDVGVLVVNIFDVALTLDVRVVVDAVLWDVSSLKVDEVASFVVKVGASVVINSLIWTSFTSKVALLTVVVDGIIEDVCSWKAVVGAADEVEVIGIWKIIFQRFNIFSEHIYLRSFSKKSISLKINFFNVAAIPER